MGHMEGPRPKRLLGNRVQQPSCPLYPERSGCPLLRCACQGQVADTGTRARVLPPFPGPFHRTAPPVLQGKCGKQLWGAMSVSGTSHRDIPLCVLSVALTVFLSL